MSATMPRCTACKHWRYMKGDIFPKTDWGGCDKMDDKSEMATAEGDYKYGLRTRKDFGCIEHEPGEPLPYEFEPLP